ncbi:hypothetical protein BU23DRAFT_461845, partial [Bimuria novae-zelandiae CBS 107.79]
FSLEISANRVTGSKLIAQAREGIISKLKASATPAELARKFRCIVKYIRDTIKKYNKIGNNTSRPRSRQPPKLTRREKRTLLQQV